jgi:hypothetical protein
MWRTPSARKVGRVAPGPLGEQRDRPRGQRLGGDAHDALARQGGEDAPHLGPLGDALRTAGEDQASGRADEAAAEQRDEVERAVVGPVEVLDDDDRGGRELVERGGEDVLARARAVERGEQRTAGLARDVAERPHGAGGDQRVARAPEDPPRVQGAADVGDERRLADARLAGHDGDAPGAARVRDRRLEDPPLAVAFEKLHRAASLTARPRLRGTAVCAAARVAATVTACS